MCREAYKEWINLFNKDFEEIWNSEQKELQRVAVLLHALRNEISNIQTNIEMEVSCLKQRLKYKDDLEKSILLDKRRDTSSLPKCSESPDLFRNTKGNVPSPSTEISILNLTVSEDETITVDASPTIKKRRKRHKAIPNQTISIVTETNDKPVTPINTLRDSVKLNIFKTPVLKPDQDLSIIECTPEIPSKRSSFQTRSVLSKKKNKKKTSNSKLTQMFRLSSIRKDNNVQDGNDSDETYFDVNTEESQMGITDLIHYINKDESKKYIANKSVPQGYIPRDDPSETIYEGLETSSQEVDQFSKGALLDENDLDLTNNENCKIVIGEPEPVVRGKARKQLHGWACQQCKNFYGTMDLSPQELQKKMDECSRHRYKYRPPEETIPGFWDLSIPPET